MLNRNIAGTWDLYDRAEAKIGYVTFDDKGKVTETLAVVCARDDNAFAPEEELVGPMQIKSTFSSLNEESLSWETTHRICGHTFYGELTVEIIGEDQIEGSLIAGDVYDVDRREPDYEPYGISAEFTGRRVRPTSAPAAAKRQRT